MNGRKAKKLRKIVYGDRNIRNTKYYRDPDTGVIVADNYRTTYQRLKNQGRLKM